jgi:hypothetical protein
MDQLKRNKHNLNDFISKDGESKLKITIVCGGSIEKISDEMLNIFISDSNR